MEIKYGRMKADKHYAWKLVKDLEREERERQLTQTPTSSRRSNSPLRTPSHAARAGLEEQEGARRTR